MARLIILAVLVGFIGALFTGVAEARTAPTDTKGERVPNGYGVEPCRTKAFDMAITDDTVTNGQWFYELNFIGCNPDTLKREATGWCSKHAYQVAREWLRNGQPITHLNIDKMYRALNNEIRNDRGIPRYLIECAPTDQGTWYEIYGRVG